MTTPTRTLEMYAPTRDIHTAWAANNPVMPDGVLCITKNRLYNGSVEYFVGDGTHTYNELDKFGCAIGADGTVAPEALPTIPVAKLPTRILTTTPSAGDLAENEVVYVVEA